MGCNEVTLPCSLFASPLSLSFSLSLARGPWTVRLKQCEDEPAAGEGNEAFGSVAGWHQVTDAYGRVVFVGS